MFYTDDMSAAETFGHQDDDLVIGRMLRAVHRLGSVNVADADLQTLDDVMDAARRLRSWIGSVEVSVSRRTSQLHAAGKAGAPIGVLADSGGQSAADAKAAADRADVCDEMPLFESALKQGAVDTGHIDAITKATRNLSDEAKAELLKKQEELLAAASNTTVDKFGRTITNMAREIAADVDRAAEADRLTRQRRNSSIRTWVDTETGMGKTMISLDPVRHAALQATIDAHLASLRQRDGMGDIPFDQLRLDAFLELAETGGTLQQRRIPEVSVVVDWRTLIDGVHPTTVCETVSGIPLPVQTVQRLCCEAEVLPVALRGSAEPLHVGTAVRTATRAQRRALAAVHRTCIHPHCSVSFEHCQIHHVVPWERGGPTDLDNLVPLCSRHHHLVHEGLWRIDLHPDRSITWTQPDGREWQTCQPADRVPVAAGVPNSGAPPGRSH